MGADAQRDQPVLSCPPRCARSSVCGIAQLGQRRPRRPAAISCRRQVADEHRLLAQRRLDRLTRPRSSRYRPRWSTASEHVRPKDLSGLRQQHGEEHRPHADPGYSRDIDEIAAAGILHLLMERCRVFPRRYGGINTAIFTCPCTSRSRRRSVRALL